MSDTFRKEYKPVSGETKDTIFFFKQIADNLLNEFEKCAVNKSIDIRCMSIAKTNLEQAVMWAVKAIT